MPIMYNSNYLIKLCTSYTEQLDEIGQREHSHVNDAAAVGQSLKMFPSTVPTTSPTEAEPATTPLPGKNCREKYNEKVCVW